MIRKLGLILCLCLFSYAAHAGSEEDTAKQEITHLIEFVKNSDATFIRNGDKHSPEEAADHLAMKYRRASRYAKTAPDFIENLASKSSWTGKAYTVELSSGEIITAQKWLQDELEKYRAANKH